MEKYLSLSICDLLVATRRYRVNFELSTRTINEVLGNKKCEPLIMKRKSDVFTIFARQYCNWIYFSYIHVLQVSFQNATWSPISRLSRLRDRLQNSLLLLKANRSKLINF